MDLCEGLVVTGKDFLCGRESLGIGECFAVVDYADGEACGAGGFGHGHGNVPATEQIQHRLRQDRFDKDFDGAAADQAVVIGGFIVEVEDHLAGCLVVHHFLCGGPNFGLDAASADGARQGAVFAHQHPRTLVAGDRAVGVHDGGERPALARSAHFHNFFEKVHGCFA